MANDNLDTYVNENHTIWWVFYEINKNKILLPLIQRRFTWDTNQICDLFDSVLRGFPIGSMLFSKISDKDNPYYHFTTDVMANNTSQTADLNYSPDDAMSVIDGQQRLYSLILCFMTGSTFKDKKNNGEDGTSKCLYINVSKKATNAEEDNMPIQSYDIRFEPSKTNDCFFNNEDSFFIKPSVILDCVENEIKYSNLDFGFEDKDKLEDRNKKMLDATINNLNLSLIKKVFDEYLDKQISNLNNDYSKLSNRQKKAKAGTILSDSIEKFEKLKNNVSNEMLELLLLICQRFMIDSNIINCTILGNQKVDSQTDIFLRLNGGGTELTFSDLLMSKLTSYFQLHSTFNNQNDNDARKIISSDVLDKIKNDHLYPPEENIMKCILVLLSSRSECGSPSKDSDLYSATSISFKYVDAINDNDLEKIGNRWEKWAPCICLTYHKIYEDLGLTHKTLTAYYSVIPIVLLFYLCGVYSEDTYVSSITDESKKIIKWFLTSACLNQVFSSSVDTKLSIICKAIHDSCLSKKSDLNDSLVDFYNKVNDEVSNPNLYEYFNVSDKITIWIETLTKGKPQTLILLSLLYPNEATQPSLHIDHMHPHNGHENESYINSMMNLKIYHGKGKRKNANPGNIAMQDDPLIYKSLEASEFRNKDNKFTSETLLLSQEQIDKLNLKLSTVDFSKTKDELRDESNKLSGTILDFVCYKDFIDARRTYITSRLTDILTKPLENMPIRN